MHNWADRIRELQSIGLTQREIGEMVGLSTSAISDIANGRTAEPGGTAAIKLHTLHFERCAPRSLPGVA